MLRLSWFGFARVSYVQKRSAEKAHGKGLITFHGADRCVLVCILTPLKRGFLYCNENMCIVCRQTADCSGLNTLLPHQEYLGLYALKHIALLILLSTCCTALTAFQAATVLWMSEDTHQHHRCFTAPLSTFPLLFSFKQAATWRWMPAPTCTVSYSSHIPVTAISDCSVHPHPIITKGWKRERCLLAHFWEKAVILVSWTKEFQFARGKFQSLPLIMTKVLDYNNGKKEWRVSV